MSIEAWRIVKTKLSKTAFDGEGARREGGRWNSVGTSLVYTASTTSLALLEILGGLEGAQLPKAYSLFRVEFDVSLLQRDPLADLPDAWTQCPPGMDTKAIGDRWVEEANSAVLGVPSAVVPHEWNYLLNPAHEDFTAIVTAEPMTLSVDPRLTAAGE